MKKLLLLVISLILVVGAFSSCARVESENEAIDIVVDLVGRSYSLNQAYYGDGLEPDMNNRYQGDYYYVSKNSAYQVRNDLLVETKAVFSKRMADDIIDIYFAGAENMGMAVFARYMVGETGYLAVNTAYENPVKKVYKYDTSRLVITKIGRNEIKATIPAIVEEGEEPFEIEVVVTYSDELGWRLDSPTY